MKREIYCQVWTVDGYQDLTEEEWEIFDNVNFHRMDGPAVMHVNGTESWWQNGKRHRTDGPAYVCQPRISWDGNAHSNIHKEWWMNGKLTRIDGPAVIYEDGRQEWWINHQRLDTDQVEIWIKENNIDLTTQEGQATFVLRWS